MSEDYEKIKMNYADGYIPNNPGENQNSKGKKSSKKTNAGFFVTIILALFIIAVGILANVILQLKAEEKLRNEQLDIIQKQLDAYKSVIRDMDYSEMYNDEEENDNTLANEVTTNTVVENKDNIINTNSLIENKTNE